MGGSGALVFLVSLAVVLAGCPALESGSSAAKSGPTPTDTPRAEIGTSATATSSQTAGTPTQTPTDAPSPERPRVVAMNYEPGYDLSLVLARTEGLRGIDARKTIYVKEVALDIRLRDGTELAVGDRFDPPDRAGYFDQRAAKALQFYSAGNVTYQGYPKAGIAGGTLIIVGNESHFEAVTGRDPVLTMVHELTHSLQQQHNLTRRSHSTFTTDGRLALNAMFEGDATLTAQQYWRLYRPDGVGPLESRNRTRSRERWRLGLSDRVRLYGARYLDWTTKPGERNASLRDPPNTTAEVMHPSTDQALPKGTVAQPDVPWPADYRDRVGELTIRYAMQTNDVSDARAARASTGWRNDVLAVYRTPDAVTAFWGTRWANASDAGEFAAAWRSALENRGAVDNGTLLTVSGGENATTMHYAIARDGTQVYVAASENTSHARTLSEGLPSRDS